MDIRERILKRARQVLPPDLLEDLKDDIKDERFYFVRNEFFPDEYQPILEKMSINEIMLDMTKDAIFEGSSPEEVEQQMEQEIMERHPLGMIKLKTIYLFHFKTKEQEDFDAQDTKYCKYKGQPYNYTIVYMTISNDISREGLVNLIEEVARVAMLSPKFNQMLFYTDIEGQNSKARYNDFIGLLLYLKGYIENATVFVSSTTKPYIVSYDTLAEKGIYVKKCLNIHNGYNTTGRRIVIYKGRAYPFRRFIGKQHQTLLCNDWFIYYSDTAFGCIKNRLLQLSGTCYLNAIVNGIILSPLVRNAALQSMRKEDASLYTKPLNLEVCEKKDPKYFFRLLYNTICSKAPLHDTVYNQDIIVEFSKLYSIDPEGGQGGHSMETMNRLLDLIDPNHIMLGYHSQHKELSGELIGTHRFPTLTSSELFAIRDGTGDFLIVERGGRIEDTIVYNGENFLLQFSIIRISSEMKAPKDTLTHAVVGIKCDGNYIVFDSNDGLLNIDWRKVGIKQGETRRLTEYMKQTYDIINITKIQTVPLYIRESAVARYNSMSPEELCDGLI
jgi:hypothetical protein